MTRSYRTEIPPTPTQRFVAILVVAHAAAIVALCFLRGAWLLWESASSPLPGCYGRFDAGCVVLAFVVGFAVLLVVAVVATRAMDYACRWLRWALTGIWVVYSEDIDEIESA